MSPNGRVAKNERSMQHDKRRKRRGELEGKVALVTGGGRGLGEAISFQLAAAGAIVVTTDIEQERVDRVAQKLAAEGSEAFAIQLDVADEEQASLAVAEIKDRYGHLDILINNAGIDATLPFEELSVEEWDQIMGVNLRGPFLLSKQAFPLMKERQSGHIVNIVSTAAKRAWANASAYHSSKWGLLGFSHALHVEARAFGIKVTAIVSGGMRTPFLFERFPDLDPTVLQDPKNVAETVLFVLSQPPETVIPEVLVLPMHETSWP